ncbi:MAG: trypsin-like peptidase domain-containing protein [candidate division WOR-3 bacterium]
MRKYLYLLVGAVGTILAGLAGWYGADKLINRGRSSEVLAQPSIRQAQITESRKTAIVTASEMVSPAVVSVSVIGTREVASAPFFQDPFWAPLFPPIYRTERVVSLGSGFIVSEDGYILTNEHVIHGGDSVVVTLSDGRSYRAELVGASERLDVALLKVKASGLPTVAFGNSDDVVPGEWAIAIGNPVGYLLEDLDPTITVGVISATGRTIKGEEGGRLYRNMIQTDAAVNPGNSGGPLVNADGEVIGMNTFIFSKSGGSEGLGFAIPSNALVKCVEEFKKYGRVREAFLPVSVQNITRELAEALDYPGTSGVAVVSSRDNALKPEDIITDAGGRPIRIVGDWEDITYFLTPGERVKVRVFRKGKYLEMELVAQEIKETGTKTSLGLEIAPITPELVEKYGLAEEQGLVIVGIQKGSFAERMGLAKGDVILKVNGLSPQTPEEFERAIDSRKGFLEMVISRKGSRFYLSYRY